MPHAGQTVVFANQSVGADDYAWQFGDNVTSDSNTPSHVYKKPGTYTVTLKITRNKVQHKSCTHVITIQDTVPAISVPAGDIQTYATTFIYADVYNPWKKNITYHWSLPEDFEITSLPYKDSSMLMGYFTQPHDQVSLALDLHIADSFHLNDQDFHLEKSINVYHQPATSLLFMQEDKAYEQFIYTLNSQRIYSDAVATVDDGNIHLLKNEQDTIYQYGTILFTVPKVAQMMGQDIKGFQVDRLLGKIYAYGNGLWVCNINGSSLVKLQDTFVGAIKVDVAGNRLYWATEEATLGQRLLQTSNNTDQLRPDTINRRSDVQCISVNSIQH